MKYEESVRKAFQDSNIAFTREELDNIEYADFGLNNIKEEGLNLIIYINNDRYCAKEMVLLAGQTCPEHQHPRRGRNQEIEGKQETFRVRKGVLSRLYGETLLYPHDKNVQKYAEDPPVEYQFHGQSRLSL